MTFQEARNRYNELRAELRAGHVDLDAFSDQVEELRVQDQAGNWWCISLENGGWLLWDGSAWHPSQPPPEELGVAPPAAPRPDECPQCHALLKAGRKFCGKCGAALGEQAPPPVAEEPVAGMPTVEIVIPAARPVGKRGTGIAGWGRATWNIFSIAGCTIVSGLWYWYSGMAETKPDYKTCAAIILLPVLTILLRKPIDRLLRPIQPTLNKIPRMVRLGIGLAIPLLVANYLYASGTIEFEYLFRTVVISALLSYVMLRVPSPLRRIGAGIPRVGI